MEKPDLSSNDPLDGVEGGIDPRDVGFDPEPALVDDGDLVEVFEFSPGAVHAIDFREVDEVRSELEQQLADTRGELGARVAELEGELEALREERAEWTRELDELEAELLQRATLLAETRASAEQLRDAWAELDQERIRLVSQVAHVQHDRERIQDDLAAQISQLASELAVRDQELARTRRDSSGLASSAAGAEAENGHLRIELAEAREEKSRATARAAAAEEKLEQLRQEFEAHSSQDAPPPAPDGDAAAEIARLEAELEDLAGENEFLNSELDRYAAQALERRTV